MRVLLALGLLVSIVLSCPALVEKFCKCEELHNGVKLDCSHTKGHEVVQLLRQNQAMLGLVQELKIQKAGLTSLPASFFAGLYIKQLDLSFNEMKEIDNNAFKGMSPVLQEISLHHNNLKNIPVGALAGINTLLRLDLSNNTIGDLGEADAFPNLPKLYDINLGSNKICNVHSNLFGKIKNTVQTINFGHNCMKSVPSSAIRGMTQLQAIHLLRNNITQLDSLNFLNLPVLNLINLAGNKISEINRQAFLNVPNLRYLYLTDNQITKIASGQFVTFERLEMLDLTRNKIETLQTGSFSQLPVLTRLYLGNNKISSIEKGAFTNSSTVIIVLSNNELEILSEGILDGLLNLQQVSFQHNKIQEINQNAFYNAPSVALVDLSYNQIVDLPPSTFLAQLNLFMIDLSSNKLVRTPYAAFNRRVGTVMLKENPLVCTEKVHLIQDGIGTYLPSEADLICGGKPTSTTGRPIEIKISPKHHTGERITKPSGAFQQEGLVPVSENSEPTMQEQIPADLLPSRQERPSILNTRPISRTRGPARSDISHTDNSREIEMESGTIQQAEPIVTVPKDEDEEVVGVEPVAVEEQPQEQSEMQHKPTPEGSTFPSLSPTTYGPRVYTDIADNPNLIHPFPVPFLKKGPMLNKAQRIQYQPTEKPSLKQEHTLPPSIVIEPRVRPATADIPENSVQEELGDKIEKFAAPQANALPEKKEFKPKTVDKGFSNGTIIIVICISLAVICMLVVFIALCALRCRKGSRFTSSYSDSSVARTNAYVQSQAQMNMIYGTLGRERCVPMAHEEGHPWVYNPGPNYCNYYK